MKGTVWNVPDKRESMLHVEGQAQYGEGVWKGVEDCGRVWKGVEGCGRVWKGMYGLLFVKARLG